MEVGLCSTHDKDGRVGYVLFYYYPVRTELLRVFVRQSLQHPGDVELLALNFGQ